MSPLRIFNYNTAGVSSHAALTMKAIETSNCDVAILTETHLADDTANPLNWHMERVSRIPRKKPPTERSRRKRNTLTARGGVAVLVSPGLRYRLLRRDAPDMYQVISISVSGIIIVGVYISPLCSPSEYAQAITVM